MNLSKLFQFVKSNFNAIVLTMIVALLVLFSFAAGYIIADYKNKEPIEIISTNE